MMISRLVWSKKKNSAGGGGPNSSGNPSSLLHQLESGVNSANIL